VPLQGVDYGAWCLRFLLGWTQTCLSMVFSMQFSLWIWTKLRYRASLRVSIVLSLLISSAVALIWIPMEVVLVLSEKTSFLPVLPFLCLLALDIHLYRFTLKRWALAVRGGMKSESSSPTPRPATVE